MALEEFQLNKDKGSTTISTVGHAKNCSALQNVEKHTQGKERKTDATTFLIDCNNSEAS